MKRLNVEDLRLYLVTDRTLSMGRDLLWIVQEAVKGGVSMVQLREKEASTRDFLELSLQLKQLLIPLHIPLIINDRIDIALACNAEGVHIGQKDMPYPMARKLLGDEKIIGLSVENMEEVRSANLLDVDYIGVSPVFSTPTKTDTSKPFGLDGLKEAVQCSIHPIVGIGGMNERTAKEVKSCGAEGIAVVSAIISAQNPCMASQKLRSMME
ncbi:MAG TPA: thiamine phosphate synthase [Porphyromonadaceae bacterium]|nr:thiamine phosphate synthase [Porphyromonadaceae bacterium]